MIARLHAAEAAVLFVLAGALTAGSPTPTFTAPDTTPPSLRLVNQNEWYPNRVGGTTLPLLIAIAYDDVAVQEVVWSTDGGASGEALPACFLIAFPEICRWEAAKVPLMPGLNLVTVTARDAAGNSTSDVLQVTARGEVATFHVDCLSPANGDGSAAAPFNTLHAALLVAASDDTIQIDGGPCEANEHVVLGVTIQGDPALPRAAIDTGGWFLDIATPEPVTVRHLATSAASPSGKSAVRVESHDTPGQLVLEDVEAFSLWARNYPLYTVRHSEDIEFFGYPSGASLRGDAEFVTGLSVGGYCYSGGQVAIRVRDSQITTLGMCDHGYFDVLIERSTIEAGVAGIWQYREGGCCELDLTIRDSIIRDTQILVDRSSYCAGGPCPPPARPSILLERNRFLNSTFELRATDQGALPAPEVADLIVQNNVMDHSSIRIGVSQERATWDSVFSGLIRHNTFINAPTAVELTGSVTAGPPPSWRAEIANNIIVGSETGVRVVGNASDLILARVAGNDFFRNASDVLVDQPVTLEGNIFLDPRFQHPFSWDLSLRPNSPCIDAGVDIVSPPPCDFVGTMRSIDGDKDGIARPDIGALEFVARRLHRQASPTPTEP